MNVLLTWLTVLVAWAFLGVLAVGLLFIVKSLQSIRGWFQQITVGLRAVEQQTKDLQARGERLSLSLRAAIEGIQSAARSVRAVGNEKLGRNA